MTDADAVLRAIEDFLCEHGYPASQEDVRRRLAWTSSAKFHAARRVLVESKLLVPSFGRVRVLLPNTPEEQQVREFRKTLVEARRKATPVSQSKPFCRRRRVRKKPPPRGRKRWKLKANDVRTIRRRVAAGEMKTDVAEDYGVCVQAVSHIISGRNWAWLQ